MPVIDNIWSRYRPIIEPSKTPSWISRRGSQYSGIRAAVQCLSQVDGSYSLRETRIQGRNYMSLQLVTKPTGDDPANQSICEVVLLAATAAWWGRDAIVK